jgi:hypothetical protein
MTYGDKEYIETKRIKELNLGINPMFKNFGKRLESAFNLTVLNIFYESLLHNKSPRIYVIYESFKKWKKEINSNTSYIERQNVYKEIFNCEFPEQKNDKLFFIDSPFDSVNINEVFINIDEFQVEEFVKPLIDKYWRIYPFGKTICVFCMENSQIEMNKKQESRIKKHYYELAKENDNFDFIKNMDSVFVKFDSKENFENKYGGSWRNYFD